MKYCNSCGNQLSDDARFCTACGATIAAEANHAYSAPAPTPGATSDQGMNFDFSNNTTTATHAAPVRYQYKVLTQKDKWFSGKFDPAILEQAINAYAQQGWRVIGCATADIPGFGTTRQEFITLLEREA